MLLSAQFNNTINIDTFAPFVYLLQASFYATHLSPCDVICAARCCLAIHDGRSLLHTFARFHCCTALAYYRALDFNGSRASFKTERTHASRVLSRVFEGLKLPPKNIVIITVYK